MKSKKKMQKYDEKIEKKLNAARKEFYRFVGRKRENVVTDYFEFTISMETLEAMDDDPELMDKFVACLGDAMKLLNCDKPVSVEELAASDILCEDAVKNARKEISATSEGAEVIDPFELATEMTYEEFAASCVEIIGDEKLANTVLEDIQYMQDIADRLNGDDDEEVDDDDEDDEYYDDEDDEDDDDHQITHYTTKIPKHRRRIHERVKDNDGDTININITFDDGEEVDDSPNHDNYGGFGSAERQERWKNFFFSNGRGRR